LNEPGGKDVMLRTDDYRLIYQGEIYDAINRFTFDFEFYKKWCGHMPGPVLELCSGTGRLTIPLKKAGLDIMGLDLSPSMLAMARAKAAAERLDLTFIQGDMRRFDLDKKFSTIFIPFNSLQDIASVADVEATLSRVRKHLEPGGLFLFDVFNPSIHLMVDREREFTDPYHFTTADGKRISVREKCGYDAATQINRVKWFFNIEGRESLEEFNIRCYFPFELELLLKYNGFEILHKFGSFEEKPFVSASTKQIFVCRQTPGPDSPR